MRVLAGGAKRAEAATQYAAAGAQEVGGSIEKIQSAAKNVAESAAIVDKLGARSKEIGTIVETISGIAEQTNLLSLNAAIEAARAGEHGRGFAVVADEVRKLASESAEAAQRIAELIMAIQKDTDAAVASMQTVSAATEEQSASASEIATASGSLAKLAQDLQASLGKFQF